MALVIMTGASGSGKTAITKIIGESHPGITVFHFDSVGVPSAEALASWGNDHQPGGAWMRATTFQWFERIAPMLAEERHVLLEGQMRIGFILDGLKAAKIENAHILCVECDDSTRMRRLTENRQQPELATEEMLGWSRYLHRGALKAGIEILDTSTLGVAECAERDLSLFEHPGMN